MGAAMTRRKPRPIRIKLLPEWAAELDMWLLVALAKKRIDNMVIHEQRGMD